MNMKIKNNKNYKNLKNVMGMIGIDEVGRGPVAGPVTVCVLYWLSKENPANFFINIRDSKKLTENARKRCFEKIQKHKNIILTYETCSVSSKNIDKNGIIHSLSRASHKAINNISKNNIIKHILSDYGLPVPDSIPSTHIIKGDEKEPLIALASIVAKVTRDRMMIEYGKIYPNYNFQKHKGYYTKEHRESIEKYGLTPIHRKTFLKNINNI